MADDGSIEIIPPGGFDAMPASSDAATALVRRVARSHPPSAELQALIDGPLRDAVAAAADYAGDAIAEPTRKAYLRDWAEFSGWCRAERRRSRRPADQPGARRRLARHARRHAWQQRPRPPRRRHRLSSPQARPAVRRHPSGHPRHAERHPPRPSAAGAPRRRAHRGRGQAAARHLSRRSRRARGPRRPADRALFLVGFAGAFRRSSNTYSTRART